MNQPATDNNSDKARLRLFIAIACPLLPKVDDVIKELQSAALEPGAGIKVVAANNLHVTLKFLGSVDASSVSDIAALLDQITTGTKPFDITLTGTGIFKDAFWLGVTHSQPLTTLAATIEQRFKSCGFSPEMRPIVPHMTVARLNKKSLIDFASRSQPDNSESWGSLHVQEVHLYQSETLPAGVQYSMLHTSGFKPLL